MCHERIINDHLTSDGGVLSVTIDKQLVTSWWASRARYTAHCEDMQRARDGREKYEEEICHRQPEIKATTPGN